MGGGGRKKDNSHLIVAQMQADANATARREDAANAEAKRITDAAEKKAKDAQDLLDAAKKERQAVGTYRRDSYVKSLKDKVKKGELSKGQAEKEYKLFTKEYEISELALPESTPGQAESTPGQAVGSTIYDEFNTIGDEYATNKKTRDIESIFQRNLYRRLTDAEKLEYTGTNQSLQEIEDDLKASDEYRKSRPEGAFQAEMEARYGGPILTTTDNLRGAGWRTGKYKLNIGKGPTLSKDISTKTGITAPDFITEGSPEDLELTKSQLSVYESFVYNSGLKSLEGSINMELDKQQNESKSRITREQGNQNLMQGLVGAFDF